MACLRESAGGLQLSDVGALLQGNRRPFQGRIEAEASLTWAIRCTWIVSPATGLSKVTRLRKAANRGSRRPMMTMVGRSLYIETFSFCIKKIGLIRSRAGIDAPDQTHLLLTSWALLVLGGVSIWI